MSFLNAVIVRISCKVIASNVIRIIEINGVKVIPIIPSDGVRITPIIQSDIIKTISLILRSGVRNINIVGGNEMGKMKTLAFKEPQEKHNLKLTPSDFREATNTGWEKQLLGEKIYIINIKIPFKYLYLPPCPFVVYLYSIKYANLMKAPQGIFVLMDIVDKIILVRPSGLVVGDIYFQYWLSNVESVKILDVYENYIGDILGSQNLIFEIPFPTYQLLVVFLVGINPTSYQYIVTIRPFSTGIVGDYEIDNAGALATTNGINNYYFYDRVGGCREVTEPSYPRPSFRTKVNIINNDAESDMEGCLLRLISFGD